jgi:hypothetical protein
VAVGESGVYQWLTAPISLAAFVDLCPQVVQGKYIGILATACEIDKQLLWRG